VTGAEATSRYAAAGIATVPLVPRSKRPLIEWAPFHDRRPTEAEITAWWTRWPNAGVAVVCGMVSYLTILDIDPRHDGERSLAAYPVSHGPTVVSGSGGRHHYFASLHPVPRIAGLLPGVDLLGAGLATAPPSIHPCGQAYRWVPGRALGDLPLPPIPNWVRQLIRERERPEVLRGHASASTTPDVETLLRRIHHVRRYRGGWLARCPAHEDRTPSLSIGIGRNGRILLHCFAGCSYQAIRTALARTDR
jgi:hypothetical protein